MYPNLGSGTTQPSAPPPPSSSLSNSGAPPSSSNLSNTRSSQPVGFSSLMAQPNNQSTPYPSGQSSQTPYPSGPPSNQPPYPSGPSSNQPPYPTGPPSSSSSSYNSPYPPSNQPPNTGNYSAYSLPNTGNQPPPPQGGSGYQQNVYQSLNPSSGYPSGQQQQPPSTGYQNPYPPSNPYQQQGNTAGQNPYRPANPYGQPQGNTGYQNPYQSQQGGYPPQQPPPPYNPQQQQPYQNPYAANPQQPPGVYPSYNQQQQPYQTPYGYQQPAGGYNPNAYGAPPANDRIRAIAGRYEINDVLAQRLNILQQFEIVVLCDDSGSMNTPVDGTNGTRWDELRSIVQIVIEIATVFDTNGVDVHFLNRPSMPNVTDPRQVVESFNKRPAGFTPLTPALRRIFQSAASKPGSDKRLLVFVATDGAPTDTSGNVDIRGLENLMRNERQSNTTYVTFLACTDDDESVGYLAQWDRTMMNVDVVDDYKSEREEIRRSKGLNYPFSFGDYVAKALLGAVDPQMDLLDESGFNNNNNFRRF
jgi:hypothetical protein